MTTDGARAGIVSIAHQIQLQEVEGFELWIAKLRRSGKGRRMSLTMVFKSREWIAGRRARRGR